MTELDWLQGSDHEAMLNWVGRTSWYRLLARVPLIRSPGTAGRLQRKLRLLACACWQSANHGLPLRPGEPMEVVSRFADGQASLAELSAARRAVVVEIGRYTSRRAALGSAHCRRCDGTHFGFPGTRRGVTQSILAIGLAQRPDSLRPAPRVVRQSLSSSRHRSGCADLEQRNRSPTRRGHLPGKSLFRVAHPGRCPGRSGLLLPRVIGSLSKYGQSRPGLLGDRSAAWPEVKSEPRAVRRANHPTETSRPEHQPDHSQAATDQH
jgi:hypothetical protein